MILKQVNRTNFQKAYNRQDINFKNLNKRYNDNK